MICGMCARYSPNCSRLVGKMLCMADVDDDGCTEWFVRRSPSHECHRLSDYEPLGMVESEEKDGCLKR